jgi:hypothetical protein
LITRFYIPMVNRKFDIPRVSTLDPNISWNQPLHQLFLIFII